MALDDSIFVGDASIPLLQATLGDCLRRQARHYAEQTALIVPEQQIHWDYTTLKEQVDRLAIGLARLGVEKGDRIALWAPPCCQWLLCQLAAARLGAIIVPLSTHLDVQELLGPLTQVGASILFYAPELDSTGRLLSLLPELARQDASQPLYSRTAPRLRHLVSCHGVRPGTLAFDWLMTDTSAEEIAALDALDLQPSDPAVVLFTSGSTQQPRAVIHSHFGVINNARLVAMELGIDSADSICHSLPFYHCFGLVLGPMLSLIQGATAVVPGQSSTAIADICQRQQCSVLMAFPATAEALAAQWGQHWPAALRLGVMVGAQCPSAVQAQLTSGPAWVMAYGQTESGAINHLGHLVPAQGTVGRAAAHQEVKLVDSHGELVPRGVRGEVCVRSYALMQGYWPPGSSSDIDSSGWLHTGDIGVMDEHGNVEIVGRTQDIIMRDGEAISPWEIEQFYQRHPQVKAIRVFGLPGESGSQRLCAWVQATDGASLSADSLRQFAAGRLSQVKIPEHFHFVSQFPLTAAGKVQTYRMREKMLQLLDDRL